MLEEFASLVKFQLICNLFHNIETTHFCENWLLSINLGQLFLHKPDNHFHFLCGLCGWRISILASFIPLIYGPKAAKPICGAGPVLSFMCFPAMQRSATPAFCPLQAARLNAGALAEFSPDRPRLKDRPGNTIQESATKCKMFVATEYLTFAFLHQLGVCINNFPKYCRRHVTTLQTE
jgi:hypothetical protein